MGGSSVNMNLTPELLDFRQNNWYRLGCDYPPAPRVGKKEQKRFASVYPDSPWNAAFKAANRLHVIWRGMIYRCYGSGSAKIFKYYRDKGITVCDKWRDSFDAFYDWAIHHGYAEELTIDRIDGNGNYCPKNCRWVTRSENSRNILPKSIKSRAGESLSVPSALKKKKKVMLIAFFNTTK